MVARMPPFGRRLVAPILLAAGLLVETPGAEAQPRGVLLEVRILDRASGAAAGWGATGQVLLPDAAPEGERQAAVSPTTQELFVPAGGRGEIRLGRAIPYVDWFLRRARAAGLAEPDAEWRDVEALLGVEVLVPAGDGAARLALTPELGFSLGRSRLRAAFASARLEIFLPPGEEVRLAPGPGQEEFYARLLVGYDPLRRVRPIDLVLRAAPAGSEEP